MKVFEVQPFLMDALALSGKTFDAMCRAIHHRLYLARETKSTLDQFAIRPTEEAKITCGKAHFAVLPDVRFGKASAPEQV